MIGQWGRIGPAVAAFALWAALAGTASADSNRIVPGKSVGKVELGMTPELVQKAMGAPSTKSDTRWEYRAEGSKDFLRVHFAQGKAVQIDFTSTDFSTENSLTVKSYRKLSDLFARTRFQREFLNLRYTLNTGGLTFFELNYDSTSETVDPVSLGVVHAGQQPPVDPLQGAQWVAWVQP